MKRHSFIRNIVPMLTLLVLAIAGQGAEPRSEPISAEVTQREIRFKVSLEKTAYVESEPIIVTLALTNVGANTLVVGELSESWTWRLEVIQVSGDKPMPGMITYLVPSMPKDFGRAFRPGESQSTQSDVNSPYSGKLPVGRYILRAEYYSEPDAVGNKRIEWKGKISVADLSFEIVAPRNDAEKAAFDLYRQGQTYIHGEKPDLHKAAIIMHGLSDSARGGVFASDAGYREAKAVGLAGDKAGYIKTLREYAEKYKNEPHYYRLAIVSLGHAFANDGKYAEARAAYERLPDTWEREFHLKLLANKMAK